MSFLLQLIEVANRFIRAAPRKRYSFVYVACHTTLFLLLRPGNMAQPIARPALFLPLSAPKLHRALGQMGKNKLLLEYGP